MPMHPPVALVMAGPYPYPWYSHTCGCDTPVALIAIPYLSTNASVKCHFHSPGVINFYFEPIPRFHQHGLQFSFIISTKWQCN